MILKIQTVRFAKTSFIFLICRLLPKNIDERKVIVRSFTKRMRSFVRWEEKKTGRGNDLFILSSVFIHSLFRYKRYWPHSFHQRSKIPAMFLQCLFLISTKELHSHRF